jgi:hypothetical protein
MGVWGKWVGGTSSMQQCSMASCHRAAVGATAYAVADVAGTACGACTGFSVVLRPLDAGRMGRDGTPVKRDAACRRWFCPQACPGCTALMCRTHRVSAAFLTASTAASPAAWLSAVLGGAPSTWAIAKFV